jgi:hypothetical protein
MNKIFKIQYVFFSIIKYKEYQFYENYILKIHLNFIKILFIIF